MKLDINGAVRDVDAPADMPLLWVLRDLVGLPGRAGDAGDRARRRERGLRTHQAAPHDADCQIREPQ